jgi:hypothetical protein
MDTHQDYDILMSQNTPSIVNLVSRVYKVWLMSYTTPQPNATRKGTLIYINASDTGRGAFKTMLEGMAIEVDGCVEDCWRVLHITNG